jgi:hypothetical protein
MDGDRVADVAAGVTEGEPTAALEQARTAMASNAATAATRPGALTLK